MSSIAHRLANNKKTNFETTNKNKKKKTEKNIGK